MIIIPDTMRRPAEVERDELKKQLVEARARIDILERAHDSLIEEQASLCAEGQSITELVAAKDKLIERMLEALEAADELIDQLVIDNTDSYAEERAKIRAAIAAAKGEV